MCTTRTGLSRQQAAPSRMRFRGTAAFEFNGDLQRNILRNMGHINIQCRNVIDLCIFRRHRDCSDMLLPYCEGRNYARQRIMKRTLSANLRLHHWLAGNNSGRNPLGVLAGEGGQSIQC